MAPPQYPGIEKYDVISFSVDPLRATLELVGNAFLLAMMLLGLVAVIMMFRRGLEWIRNWPYVLPGSLVLAYWATVATTLVGRDDWIIPASLLLGAVSIGSDWISLRQHGMPFSARVSDMMAASG